MREQSTHTYKLFIKCEMRSTFSFVMITQNFINILHWKCPIAGWCQVQGQFSAYWLDSNFPVSFQVTKTKKNLCVVVIKNKTLHAMPVLMLEIDGMEWNIVIYNWSARILEMLQQTARFIVICPVYSKPCTTICVCNSRCLDKCYNNAYTISQFGITYFKNVENITCRHDCIQALTFYTWARMRVANKFIKNNR